MTIKEWQTEIRACNAEHGFESEVTNAGVFSEKLLLIVSEISEAMEEFRDHHDVREIYYKAEKPDKPEGIPVELADATIRILDFCEANGINLEEVIALKHAYNKTRPYKHGGKKI
jgi:hypothetical protein